MTEKRYTETVRKLRDDKLQLKFGDAVREDFARLYEKLKDEEGFDYDALMHMKDFMNPVLKRDVPIALVATIEVFKQVTEFARKTKNPSLLEDLEKLQTDLSGFGAEKAPFCIVSVTPHR